jgi:hypothetical protein
VRLRRPGDVVTGVHRLRDTDRETLETARQTRRARRLDQQVQMTTLNGEVETSKVFDGGGRESGTNGSEGPISAERRHADGGPQRHVRGTASLVRNAAAVRHRAASR